MNSTNNQQLTGVANSTKGAVTRNGLNAEGSNNMKLRDTMII